VGRRDYHRMEVASLHTEFLELDMVQASGRVSDRHSSVEEGKYFVEDSVVEGGIVVGHIVGEEDHSLVVGENWRHNLVAGDNLLAEHIEAEVDTDPAEDPGSVGHRRNSLCWSS
jgi:hypothetical protein